MRHSRLREEIKQTKPFPSLEAEASLALLRTADVVRTRIASTLNVFDVTMQQYNVLRILRGAGAEGLPTLEIAHRMIEHAPGITRLIDRLVAKDLVRRERCPTDRRQVLCTITDAGLAQLAEIDEPLTAADRDAIGHLDDATLTTLIETLDAIRGHCIETSVSI